jgi:hypothetical protein
MSDSVRLVPRPGGLVRDPHTKRALPPEGAPVVLTPYWVRRIAAGDVVIAPSTPASEET